MTEFKLFSVIANQMVSSESTKGISRCHAVSCRLRAGVEPAGIDKQIRGCITDNSGLSDREVEEAGDDLPQDFGE